MTVQDFITLVRYSELNNIAVGSNTDAVITFINLGLIELYTRFPIKVKEHIVNLSEGVTDYAMPTDFMYALNAYGETQEENPEVLVRLSINEEDDPYSIFFPDWNSVQIPLVANGSSISIIYVATPIPVQNTVASLTTELAIPDTLIDALASYVGYRGHLSVRGDGQSENNAHWVRFDRNCSKARELGVAYPYDSDSFWSSSRLFNRGFV
jgi:hypothetical protein